MKKSEVDNAIREKFRVKKNDIPPFTGWLKPSSRLDLEVLMNELGCFKKGAEIGVQYGKHAEQMYKTINGLHLIGVDPWTKYSNHTQESMDAKYENTMERLKPYPNITIIRKTSMDAVKDVANESLDFVYIDGFHDFDWVMSDLIFWAPKVRSAGIIAGHDYYPFFRAGVMTAVDAYVKGHHVTDWYVTREKEPTWFWVKK
jgi:hypothetical protein